MADGKGIPLGSSLTSASPAEVKLATQTLEKITVPRNGPGRPKKRPKRLIGEKAYDSDALRKELKQRGVDFIAPHRKNRTKPKIQDGRKLRRYRRRWIVERTIAWIGNFRRLTVRYEKLITVYQAFFHIACLLIALSALSPS